MRHVCDAYEREREIRTHEGGRSRSMGDGRGVQRTKQAVINGWMNSGMLSGQIEKRQNERTIKRQRAMGRGRERVSDMETICTLYDEL